MSQHPLNPSPTPPWGTPTGPATTGTTATPPLPETQVIAPVIPQNQRPTREAVELRVTALHYAQRILGDWDADNPDVKLATTVRIAKGVEQYLLSGQTV